jgi:arylformamidase
MALREVIFLGYPLTTDAPSPPAIPKIQLDPFLTLGKDGANVTMMKLTSHTGTHMDVPLHVIDGGLSITDLHPEDFYFRRPTVINLTMNDAQVVQPEHLASYVEEAREADLLLFRFGYGPIRHQEALRYSQRSPGFGVESARFLLDNFPGMRGVGMDVPSLSCIEHLDQTFQAHHVLLGGGGRRFIVIEDMNLDQDLTRLSEVLVAPLMVEHLDGGPVTAFGFLN